jgi:hypothetical protein
VNGAVQLSAALAESQRLHSCFARHVFRSVEGRHESTSLDACTLDAMERAAGTGSIEDVVRALITSPDFTRRLMPAVNCPMRYDRLSRRHFLQGLGASLTLSLLPSLMGRAEAQTMTLPRFFVTTWVGHGGISTENAGAGAGAPCARRGALVARDSQRRDPG